MNPLCGDCGREGLWDGNVCVCPKCGLELATRPTSTGSVEPPAPSQSAREIAAQIVSDVLETDATLYAPEAVAKVTRELDAFLAQQLAAKDAENAELRAIREVVVMLLVKVTGWTRDRVEESPFNAAEAAEREPDSLRVTVQQAHAALLTKLLAKQKAFRILDAALKAGKDGQQ
jgi:hypothetical protein